MLIHDVLSTPARGVDPYAMPVTRVPETTPRVAKLIASALKHIADVRGPLRGIVCGHDLFALMGIPPEGCTLLGIDLEPEPPRHGLPNDGLLNLEILLCKNTGPNEWDTLGFPPPSAPRAQPGSWWMQVVGEPLVGILLGYHEDLPVLNVSPVAPNVLPRDAGRYQWSEMPLPRVAEVWSSYNMEHPYVVTDVVPGETGVFGTRVEYMPAKILDRVVPGVETARAEIITGTGRQILPMRMFLDLFHYNGGLLPYVPTVWDRLTEGSVL